MVGLRALIISHQQTGARDEIIAVCLTRMGASMCMDLGMTQEQFCRFAGDQYALVPLLRKPNNVIPIKGPRGS